MISLLALAGVFAAVGLFPRMVVHNASGELLFGGSDDPAIITAVRVGTFGTALVLVFLYISSN